MEFDHQIKRLEELNALIPSANAQIAEIKDALARLEAISDHAVSAEHARTIEGLRSRISSSEAELTSLLQEKTSLQESILDALKDVRNETAEIDKEIAEKEAEFE